MSTTLQEELERSFGAGPACPPVEETLRSGRRALRRRRTAVTAAALGVVTVLGIGYTALGPGASGTADGLVAVDPTPSPTPMQPNIPRGEWEDNTPVRYADGELQVHEGVVVHEWINNPFFYEVPFLSDALDLTFEGERQWVVVSGTPDGYGYSGTVPSDDWTGFHDYVTEQVEQTTGGADGWPDTLLLADDGRVVASEGSEILQRSDDPRLGPAFAERGTPTGVALVRAGEDVRDYLVAWRVVDGELEVITVPPDEVLGATFQQMLRYARSQFATVGGDR